MRIPHMQEKSHGTIEKPEDEKPEDLSNAENFKKAFKPYLIKWGICYGILMGFVTLLGLTRLTPHRNALSMVVIARHLRTFSKCCLLI